MKILVATQKPFSKEAISLIKKVIEDSGHTMALFENYNDKTDLMEVITDADALIVRSDIVCSRVMKSAPKLKVIARAGSGYDNIKCEFAKEQGIVVMNTPGQNANAVAELVIAFALFASRNQFNSNIGCELKGKTMGIHGFGQIGKLVAEKVKALGMNVLGYHHNKSADYIESYGVSCAKDTTELYKNSDFISLHIPSRESNKGVINYDLLKLLPQNACIINTARKDIINEAELIKILEERPDLKFISDLAPDSMEVMSNKFENRVYSTKKKIGAQTKEANINAGVAAAQQIIDFFKTGKTDFQVN